MKTRTKSVVLALLLAICLCMGCASNPIKVNTLPKGYDYNAIDWNKGRMVKASASGFQLLLVIPIKINDRQERAYQSIREQAGTDFITNVKVKESWAYGLAGTLYTTSIEAMCYPLKP